MCFSATLEASVAHLVNDYMRKPVRLAFGSTLKPSENVRVQAFEVTADRKQDLLQQPAGQGNGPMPGLHAHQARNRPAGQEPDPRRIYRGHDSRRPLAIAAHGGADRISSRDATACWWRPTWLRAAFTCRTSRTSSITTCPKWRKTSSTASDARAAPGKTGVASTLYGREQRPNCCSSSARSASAWSVLRLTLRLTLRDGNAPWPRSTASNPRPCPAWCDFPGKNSRFISPSSRKH